MEPYAESVKGVDEALRRLNATLESYRIRSGSPSTTPSSATRSVTPPPPPPPPPPEDPNLKAEMKRNLLAADKPYDDGLARLQAMTSELVRTEPETFARIAKGLLPKEAFELILREMWNLRSTASYPEITNTELRISLNALKEITALIDEHPYSHALYNFQAEKYLHLGYPDLASGAAYKALLLSDATRDESDEYHERAFESLRDVVRRQPTLKRKDVLDRSEAASGTKGAGKKSAKIKKDFQLADDEEVKLWLSKEYEPETYRLLARSIFLCGCYSTAGLYCAKALQLYPQDAQMQQIRTLIVNAVAQHYKVTAKEVATKKIGRPSDWPDQGLVRREQYPWNDYEVDRLDNLEELNEQMSHVAPKLEIRVVNLPALGTTSDPSAQEFVPQLGVFAREDIAPGEVVLDETSLLTANNKLQDALCDACSADLPALDSPEASSVVACPDCDIVFCSEACLVAALETYHPAVCERDVDAIAKDVPPAQAADSLYSLLLLRVLAMAETQECHPLELEEVQYIWADFHTVPLNSAWRTVDLAGKEPSPFPQTLPFSFEQNVRLPFHMLEKMDIDIFASRDRYDVWVFNTLYAKFRGTASARLSGLGGRAARGPEVSAVHPMWCMANHSCDPNVSWEWGGSIRFWAREERPEWKGEDGKEGGMRSTAGIKKGEEILNHYCDVDLPVKERREWARGALGGDCRCRRCVFEAGEGVAEEK